MSSAAAVLALLATVGPLSGSAAASPAPSVAAASSTSMEGDFLTQLNQERVSAGLHALVSDQSLANTSRSWSATMAGRNELAHDPDLASDLAAVEPRWTWGAENVGVGYSVASLHDAFMASAPHRANILSSRPNRVGIGVVVSGGRIWVTVRFLAGPSISGPTGLEVQPTPPPAPVPAERTIITADLDGDTFDDVYTYGPGSERDTLMLSRGDGTFETIDVVHNGRYLPFAGDFDGDGRAEIVFYGAGAGPDYLWQWNGSGMTTSAMTISGRYRVGVGDFDGDGVDEALFHDPGPETDYLWDPGQNNTRAFAVNGDYRLVIGDYNGDQRDDILFYAPGPASDYLWYGLASSAQFATRSTQVSGGYRTEVADLNADERDDILFHAPGTAQDYLWFGTSTTIRFSSIAITANGSYLPEAADLAGDAAAELIMYAPGAAPDFAWQFRPGEIGRPETTAVSVVGAPMPSGGDFDADGGEEVLWFSPDSPVGDPIWSGTTTTNIQVTQAQG